MKKVSLILCVLFVVALSGCESMSDGTKKGAGIGAVAGAAIGGIAGHQGGHGWEGALIGGAVGATAGGLIGNQTDKSTNANFVGLPAIVQMAKDGVPDSVIIDEIQRSKSKYELDSAAINYLKDNGVGDTVIDYMLSTK